jgi:hypothetical protein
MPSLSYCYELMPSLLAKGPQRNASDTENTGFNSLHKVYSLLIATNNVTTIKCSQCAMKMKYKITQTIMLNVILLSQCNARCQNMQGRAYYLQKLQYFTTLLKYISSTIPQEVHICKVLLFNYSQKIHISVQSTFMHSG